MADETGNRDGSKQGVEVTVNYSLGEGQTVDDIVNRLHDWHGPVEPSLLELVVEALDEIERLRTEVRRAGLDRITMLDELMRAEREIKRLLEELSFTDLCHNRTETGTVLTPAGLTEMLRAMAAADDPVRRPAVLLTAADEIEAMRSAVDHLVAERERLLHRLAEAER